MLFTCYKLPCVVTIVMRFLPLTVTSLALFFLNKLRPRSLKRITALSNMALKKNRVRKLRGLRHLNAYYSHKVSYFV